MSALLLLLLPTAAWAGDKPARSDALAQQADQALDAGDLMLALKLAYRAVKLDDANADAHFVLGNVLGRVSTVLQGDSATAASTAAANEMKRVIELEPDSLLGAIARDAMEGTLRLQVPEPECPAAARAAYDEAEKAFARGDLTAAESGYAVALEGCPANPVWWTWAGDVPFRRGDYAAAQVFYDRALEVAPCHAPAWRFKADSHGQRREWQPAFHASLRATGCDPTYGAGRESLEAFARLTGRSLDPAVAAGWRVQLEGEAQASHEAIWHVYESGSPAGDTELARRTARVRSALLAWGELGSPDLPMWRVLAEAEAAGLRDAAIFWFFLDDALAPEFGAWRDAHVEELAAFADRWLVRPAGR